MKAALVHPRGAATAAVSGGTPSWRVVTAITRVEGRRLIRHPAVITGVLLSLLWLRMYLRSWVPVLHRDDIGTAPALFPLAAMTLVAANLAALRSRNDSTEELYTGVPVSRLSRTVAHLLSLAWPAALAAALVGGWVVWTTFVLDGVGRPSPAELATGPLLVLNAGLLGVALARWVPVRQAAFVAVVGLAAAQILMTGSSDTTRWLAPWTPPAGDDLFLMGDLPREIMVRRPGVHLAYLAALGSLVAVVALIRHGRRAWSVAAVGTTLALVGGTAWAQVRPPSRSEIASVVDVLEHPDRVQDCEVRENVRYCAYPAYTGLVDRWAGVVAGALAPAPDQVRTRALEVRQRSPLDVAALPREAEAQLTFRTSNERAQMISHPDDRALHPEMRWGRGEELGTAQLWLAVPAAAWALDLPMAGPADGLLCSVGGQARTVIALWLAGRATPHTEAGLRRALERSAGGVVFQGLRTIGGLGTTVVLWDVADVQNALALLDRPYQEVADFVRTEWEWIADPAISSEMLASRLALPPAGGRSAMSGPLAPDGSPVPQLRSCL